MRLSCVTCRSSLWVEHELLAAQAGFACERCGSRHDLEQHELGDAEELNRRGLELATEHELDLATANSVVLGLLSLEIALSPEPPPPSVTSSEEAGGEPAEQPEEPADPAKQAELLARRSGLPFRLARRVVEGELTLHAARMLKPKPAPRAVAAPAAEVAPGRGNRLWIATVALVAVLVVGSLIAWLWLRGRDVATAPDPVPLASWAGQATVERNGAGEVVRITGPDPQSVLAAFCAAGSVEGQRVPFELRVVDRRAGLRWGVYRTVGEEGRSRAIRIERRGREWTAGDGRSPVDGGVAPEPGPSTVSIPLSSLRRDD